jgi:hypothetical protein
VQPASGRQSVPTQVTNAVASLRPFDAEINVAGEWITVPAAPAADWLELLMGNIELFAIFPGLCDEEDQEYVESCLRSGAVSVFDIENATLDLIETVSGRPWWIALRIIQLYESAWGIVGAYLIQQGIDTTRISLAAWLDVAWPTLFMHLPDDKWSMFAAQIEAPPPEEAQRSSIETVEMSQDTFTALMRG